MKIDAKAPQVRHAIGRIGNLAGAILLQRVWRQSGQHDRFNFGTIQRLGFDIAHAAFVQHTHGRSGHQQQIAAAFRQQRGEPAIQRRGVRRLVAISFRACVQFTYDAIQVARWVHCQPRRNSPPRPDIDSIAAR